MNNKGGTLRICEKGHRYYKSSDCPTCPQCESERKPETGFLSLLSAPARRALENNNILKLKDLTHFTENEILELHGIGKNAVLQLKEAMQQENLQFKTNRK